METGYTRVIEEGGLAFDEGRANRECTTNGGSVGRAGRKLDASVAGRRGERFGGEGVLGWVGFGQVYRPLE